MSSWKPDVEGCAARIFDNGYSGTLSTRIRFWFRMPLSQSIIILHCYNRGQHTLHPQDSILKPSALCVVHGARLVQEQRHCHSRTNYITLKTLWQLLTLPLCHPTLFPYFYIYYMLRLHLWHIFFYLFIPFLLHISKTCFLFFGSF